MPDPDHSIFLYNVLAILHIAGSSDVSMRGTVKVLAENIGRVEINLNPTRCADNRHRNRLNSTLRVRNE